MSSETWYASGNGVAKVFVPRFSVCNPVPEVAVDKPIWMYAKLLTESMATPQLRQEPPEKLAKVSAPLVRVVLSGTGQQINVCVIRRANRGASRGVGGAGVGNARSSHRRR